MAASPDKVFGVQRHDADRAGLHYDLRLERDGVLKSWSMPKGMPTTKRRLALATPDHKMSWLEFEGDIPKGNYGAGNVKLDSKSTFKTISYKPKKWVFYVNSGKYKGKYTLVYWKDYLWLITRNKDQSMAAENTVDITKAKNYNQKPIDSIKYGWESDWSGETVNFSPERVIVLNNLEELLGVYEFAFQDRPQDNYYYINFDLTVYRGSNPQGQNWTWKRWLDHNNMGTVSAMGYGNVQPTTLVFQEALDYARGVSNPHNDYEIYSMDIKDYIVSFPRPSQSIHHRNCNPVTTPYGQNSFGTMFKVIKCDQRSHMKLMNATAPVIFIYGGVNYEDMTVVWDSSISEIVEDYDADENTEVLNAEWFTWYSGQYVLARNVYRIYNRSVVGEEIVLPEEYSILDDAVEELVNFIEYDTSIYEMGVYKIQSGMAPQVSLEVRYKHKEFSGNNPEAVKLADEKSYDRWNRDYLIDEPDDFLIGATDYGDIIAEVFEGEKIERPKLHFMDPKRRLRKLIKDIDLDPETAAKRISFNSERR